MTAREPTCESSPMAPTDGRLYACMHVGGRTHTYIWYSSIASTNCPHESKSVPFLKLACHFCRVLLTSDMLVGRVPAADSGQHSREQLSSTGDFFGA